MGRAGRSAVAPAASAALRRPSAPVVPAPGQDRQAAISRSAASRRSASALCCAESSAVLRGTGTYAAARWLARCAEPPARPATRSISPPPAPMPATSLRNTRARLAGAYNSQWINFNGLIGLYWRKHAMLKHASSQRLLGYDQLRHARWARVQESSA